MFVQQVDGFFVPANCRQCEQSPCVEVCPTGACDRTGDGLVRIAPMKCVGCKLCSIACPFGAIWFDALDKISRKCELCLDVGRNGTAPLCVAACGEKDALHCGEAEKMLGLARSKGRPLIMSRAGGVSGTLVSLPEREPRTGDQGG
jgi:Fe-S-cluster-containing dehydrogenase component